MREGLDPNELFEGIEPEKSEPLKSEDFELSKDEKLKRAAADAKQRADLKASEGFDDGKTVEMYKPVPKEAFRPAETEKHKSPFSALLEDLAKLKAETISLQTRKDAPMAKKNPAEMKRIEQAEKELNEKKKAHLEKGFTTSINERVAGDVELGTYLAKTGEALAKRMNEELAKEGKPLLEREKFDELMIKSLAADLASKKDNKLVTLYSGPLSTISAYENVFKMSKDELWTKVRTENQRLTGVYGQKNIPGGKNAESKKEKMVPEDFGKKFEKETLVKGFASSIKKMLDGDAELNSYVASSGRLMVAKMNEELKKEGKPELMIQKYDEPMIRRLAEILAETPLSLTAKETGFAISNDRLQTLARMEGQKLRGQKNTLGSQRSPEAKKNKGLRGLWNRMTGS